MEFIFYSIFYAQDIALLSSFLIIYTLYLSYPTKHHHHLLAYPEDLTSNPIQKLPNIYVYK